MEQLLPLGAVIFLPFAVQTDPPVFDPVLETGRGLIDGNLVVGRVIVDEGIVGLLNLDR